MCLHYKKITRNFQRYPLFKDILLYGSAKDILLFINLQLFGTFFKIYLNWKNSTLAILDINRWRVVAKLVFLCGEFVADADSIAGVFCHWWTTDGAGWWLSEWFAVCESVSVDGCRHCWVTVWHIPVGTWRPVCSNLMRLWMWLTCDRIMMTFCRLVGRVTSWRDLWQTRLADSDCISGQSSDSSLVYLCHFVIACKHTPVCDGRREVFSLSLSL